MKESFWEEEGALFKFGKLRESSEWMLRHGFIADVSADSPAGSIFPGKYCKSASSPFTALILFSPETEGFSNFSPTY